jgi:exodeoxyribonuclease VII small subunit
MSRPLAWLGFLALVLLAAACGEPDPEEALRKASAVVVEREAVLAEAQSELEAGESSLEEAQANHDRAVQAVRDAEQRLRAAEDEVAEYANDDVLFRTVQRHLLEESDLEGVAIAAEVEDRVVTLTGTVDDVELRDLAVSLAEETPGVAHVRSQIRVRAEPAPAPPPSLEAVPEAEAEKEAGSAT